MEGCFFVLLVVGVLGFCLVLVHHNKPRSMMTSNMMSRTSWEGAGRRSVSGLAFAREVDERYEQRAARCRITHAHELPLSLMNRARLSYSMILDSTEVNYVRSMLFDMYVL